MIKKISPKLTSSATTLFLDRQTDARDVTHWMALRGPDGPQSKGGSGLPVSASSHNWGSFSAARKASRSEKRFLFVRCLKILVPYPVLTMASVLARQSHNRNSEYLAQRR
jgi:hypothetical protein